YGATCKKAGLGGAWEIEPTLRRAQSGKGTEMRVPVLTDAFADHSNEHHPEDTLRIAAGERPANENCWKKNRNRAYSYRD
ncbi:hypothetical protein QMO17_32420, partial [Klebsiella pneumoniae]|nr:hypothetical protein [Klebsiella pneumoniae]